MHAPSSPTSANPLARGLVALSEKLLVLERRLILALMTLLLALILLNITTRYAGTPIYWVDEASVYSIVWLTFIGASAMTRLRLDFAVTLLTDKLSPTWAQRMKTLSATIVVGFGVALAAMCFSWMDPIGLARVGFDAAELGATTFNFLYTERTQTLNWPTWIFYLILPIFSVFLTIHGIANLLENAGLIAPVTRKDFSSNDSAEGIA